MADNKSEFENIDKQVFAIAGLLDAQLRLAGLNAGFEEIELDYLKNWLNKEKDPLIKNAISLINKIYTYLSSFFYQERWAAS